MAAKKKTNTDDAPKKERKLDLFKQVLPAIDKKDINFYSRCTEEEQKEIAPLVLMRWASSVSDPLSSYYIWIMNERVNMYFWDLSKHPELQWKLMASGGSGGFHRHIWIPNSKKKNTNKLDKILLTLYPSLSDFELSIYKNKLTKDSLKELLKDMAMTDEEIKPIMDEFKKNQDAIG